MATLPESLLARIQFLENVIPKWEANRAELNLTSGQVASMSTLISAARDAYTSVEQIRAESKDTTLEYHNAVSEMTELAADLIRTIRNTAQSTDNPDIYAMGGIPAPATPTPAGAPPAPTGLAHTLDASGAIHLSWKGTLSHRVFYKVYRRLSGETGFTVVAALAGKEWVDSSVPPGTEQATYFIRGQRGSSEGDPSAWYPVNFGYQAGDAEGGLSLAA